MCTCTCTLYSTLEQSELQHLLVKAKGTVQKDFFRPPFFHNLNMPGPLNNVFKYLRFWLRFCRVIRRLCSKKLIPRGGGGYYTLGRLTRRGIIPVRLRKIQITKVENMLTYWSMVQAGSNEVENLVGQSL